MTQEQKAQIYGELLNQHTRISNQISEIKGRNFEQSKEENLEIEKLKNRQIQIMNEINRLLS